ncbi:MAG: hypothetical protein GX121_01245 [Ignavibacteria bacterium]|nr:hypothetical protein [Ignavibacteria bacterium]
MKNKNFTSIALIIFAAFIILLVFRSGKKQAVPTNQTEFSIQTFPFEKGAYWIYKGEVLWSRLSDTTWVIDKDTLIWKMEVLEVTKRGIVTGILLKGFPTDLTWYEKGREPRKTLLVKVGSKYFYGNKEAWERINDENDNLIALVAEGDIILDLPLWKGKNYGETVQLTRPDSSYCWFVTDEKDLFCKNTKGVDPNIKRKQFSIRYRTMPEHEIFDFISGIGFTRYIYQHHGTASEVDVKLIEYYVP